MITAIIALLLVLFALFWNRIIRHYCRYCFAGVLF